MPAARFAAPRAPLEIRCPEPALLALAERLWEPGGDGAIPFRVTVVDAPPPGPLPERHLLWRVSEGRVGGSIRGALVAAVDVVHGRLRGFVSRALLSADPALVARALLEAPVATLLTFRLAALHAAAVVGPEGAAVLRGAPGAGKSTLAAACHRAGLHVLSDESLLADPAEPDLLLAAVRDLTLVPGSPALEGLATSEAFSGGERKRRVDLFTGARPADRTALRAATVLLGTRAPGPARLVPLDAPAFLAGFPEGAIPQEAWGAGAGLLAAAWAGRATFRLEGHEDLAGAVACVRSVTS